MLKVTENGITITLNGKPSNDILFWLTLMLVVLAIGVALAMIFLPMKVAIACLVLLVVVSFVFNGYKQRITEQKSVILISHGTLNVQQGLIAHHDGIKQQHIMLLADDTVTQRDSSLIVYGANQKPKCRVSGFDHDKEIEVMAKILQGHTMNKRHANIKMQNH